MYICTPLPRLPCFRFDRGQTPLLSARGTAPSLVVRGDPPGPANVIARQSPAVIVVRLYQPQNDPCKLGQSRYMSCIISQQTTERVPALAQHRRSIINHRREAYRVYRSSVQIRTAPFAIVNGTSPERRKVFPCNTNAHLHLFA